MGWFVFRNLLFVVIIHGTAETAGECVFPEYLRGEWLVSRDNTTISFTDHEVSNFLLPDSPSIQDAVGTSYTCVGNSTTKYVIRVALVTQIRRMRTHDAGFLKLFTVGGARSTNISAFSPASLHATNITGCMNCHVWTCLHIMNVTTSNVTFAQATKPIASKPENCKMLPEHEVRNDTVFAVCDLQEPYPPGNHHLLLRNASTSSYPSSYTSTISPSTLTSVPEEPSGTRIPSTAIVTWIAVSVSVISAVAVVLVVSIILIKRYKLRKHFQYPVRKKTAGSSIEMNNADSPKGINFAETSIELKNADSPIQMKSADSPTEMNVADSQIEMKSVESPTEMKSVDSPTDRKVEDGHIHMKTTHSQTEMEIAKIPIEMHTNSLYVASDDLN